MSSIYMEVFTKIKIAAHTEEDGALEMSFRGSYQTKPNPTGSEVHIYIAFNVWSYLDFLGGNRKS